MAEEKLIGGEVSRHLIAFERSTVIQVFLVAMGLCFPLIPVGVYYSSRSISQVRICETIALKGVNPAELSAEEEAVKTFKSCLEKF